MTYFDDLTSAPFLEGTTPKITYVVKDEDGVVVAGTSLTTMTATIVSRETRNKLTGWDATDINGAQGNSVDGSGVGTWNLPASATVKLTSATGDFSAHEDYDIVIKYTYGSARVGKHTIIVRIVESLE